MKSWDAGRCVEAERVEELADELTAALEAHDAEVARLKGALEKVTLLASPPPHHDGTPEHLKPNWPSIVRHIDRIARAALASPGGEGAAKTEASSRPHGMTDAETAEHLRRWVIEKPGLGFGWPTDGCGYDQHIRFVQHRNANWHGVGPEAFDTFVLAYAESLSPVAPPSSVRQDSGRRRRQRRLDRRRPHAQRNR
jgi:hypothetical protein